MQCRPARYAWSGERTAGLVLVNARPAIQTSLGSSRQNEFLSAAECERSGAIHDTSGLSVAQQLYNCLLNGD